MAECDCDYWDEETESVLPYTQPHACAQQDSIEDFPDED